MSNIKRKIKRTQKGNIKSPWVKSFCEPEGFVTFVYYDGKSAFTFTEGATASSDDLPMLDKAITGAFKRLPWYSLDDLLKIADFIIDNGLMPVEEKVKDESKVSMMPVLFSPG